MVSCKLQMGGINSFLSMEAQCKLPKVSQVPTVIFGMDVSHGNVGFSDSPSIAAVSETPNFKVS
jgi:eukaryotic translation initiation factor 2C